MSNKLYKEDTKKKKKKETEIGTFMGRIIYGCTLSLIAILLLIAFFVPSNINEPRAFTGFVIMIIVLSIFAAYGIGLTLLSKHSIKFKDWFEKDMMKLYNLTPPEDINNTEQFVISSKLDIENPIIRINTAFKGCSSLEKISVLPRIYHN